MKPAMDASVAVCMPAFEKALRYVVSVDPICPTHIEPVMFTPPMETVCQAPDKPRLHLRAATPPAHPARLRPTA